MQLFEAVTNNELERFKILTENIDKQILLIGCQNDNGESLIDVIIKMYRLSP